MHHTNVNVNLIVEFINQIKSGITINIDMSENIWKNIMFAKKAISRILLHIVAKMVNTKQALLMIQ